MVIYTTIALSKSTRNALASICTKDQTFDEVIKLLIKKVGDKNASDP
jgi:hypothetical protein